MEHKVFIRGADTPATGTERLHGEIPPFSGEYYNKSPCRAGSVLCPLYRLQRKKYNRTAHRINNPAGKREMAPGAGSPQMLLSEAVPPSSGTPAVQGAGSPAHTHHIRR